MKDEWETIAITLAVAFSFICIVLLATAVYQLGTVQEVRSVKVVRDAERVCNGGKGGCVYIVFTDKETFENADSLWHWKWNSSDLHARFQKGRCFDLTVYGWRVPLLSMYRNIIDAREVKCDAAN